MTQLHKCPKLLLNQNNVAPNMNKERNREYARTNLPFVVFTAHAILYVCACLIHGGILQRRVCPTFFSTEPSRSTFPSGAPSNQRCFDRESMQGRGMRDYG